MSIPLPLCDIEEIFLKLFFSALTSTSFSDPYRKFSMCWPQGSSQHLWNVVHKVGQQCKNFIGRSRIFVKMAFDGYTWKHFCPTQVICMVSSTQLHFSIFYTRYFSVLNFNPSHFHPHTHRCHLMCLAFFFKIKRKKREINKFL